MEYLYILQQALVWIITIFWLYNIIISVCSLVKLKDKKMLINKEQMNPAIHIPLVLLLTPSTEIFC